MKKIILFALLSSVSALGQAYSSAALQNSPGNFSRAVPYAQITLCVSTDTAVPCTQRATTYTDDTLITQCTQRAASGVLTGLPAWGANCNNPGLADATGNFTLFAVAGNYQLCVYARTWSCQEISIGGGGGGPAVHCAAAVNGSVGAFTSASAFSCDPNFVTDFNGHITAQSAQFLGPVNGFTTWIGGGAAPGTDAQFKLPTNAIRLVVPSTVGTPYYFQPPAVRCAIGQGWGLASEVIDANGDPVDTYQCQDVGVISTHGLAFTIYNASGLASGSTTASTAYLTVPFACTIQAYNLAIDAGTITVKFWKVATGTAIPTSGTSINTSGVGISSGTAIHSTTLSDFTTTAVTANDIMAMNITAVATATVVNGVLQCQ